jgi:DnaK suppressor protein
LILIKRHAGRGDKLKLGPICEVSIVAKSRFSEFEALLQSQREQLLGEVREKIAASGEGLGFVNQSKITDDDGLADAAAEMDVALVIRESQELQGIEAALGRVREGSYGTCVACGDEIGRARLKAYPAAERCRPCQEALERAQARTHAAGV